MVTEKVGGYTRIDRGQKIKVPDYRRKKRPSHGSKRIKDKKPIRYKPKTAVRDQYGHIVGYKL